MSEHELWNELGNLYFMSGAYDQAIYAYNRSIELDDEFGKPYSNLALVYVQKGKFTDAVELYRRSIILLDDIREKATSWNRLGDLYRQLRVYDEAVEAYQHADQLNQAVDQPQEEFVELLPTDEWSSDVPGVDETPEVDVDMEAEMEAAGSAEESISFEDDELMSLPVDETISWTPDSQLADEVDVSESLEDGFANTSDQVSLEEIQAEANLVATNWLPQPVEVSFEPVSGDQARQVETVKAIYASPVWEDQTSPESETSAGDLVPQSDDQASDEPDVELIEEAEMASDFEEAIEESENSFTPDEEPEATELSIEEQRYRADTEMNIARFKKILQINPRNSIAWDTLGGLYKSIGSYQDALLAFQRAVSIDSAKALYYHHLAMVYAAEGRDEDAMEAFQKVIELEPEHGLAHATLGGYYKKLGLEDLAQTHIGKAMKIIYDSENEYNRACLEAICGNIDKALDLLRVALENKQTYIDWIMRDPDLDFIRNEPRFKDMVAEFSSISSRQRPS